MSSINTTDLGGLSKQYAARDLPAHQKLKYRDIGQAAPDEIKKDKRELKRELESKEKSTNEKDSNKRAAITSEPVDKASKKKK
jgi:protein CWC15